MFVFLEEKVKTSAGNAMSLTSGAHERLRNCAARAMITRPACRALADDANRCHNHEREVPELTQLPSMRSSCCGGPLMARGCPSLRITRPWPCRADHER